MILDICPKVEGVNFTDVPDDDTTLAFLIKLGYKGLLYKRTNMFVDHMHQPWRTMAAIINKCLFGKTTSNDKLCKSSMDILWGMFYRENVDYPELIWGDLAYQIDHRKEKRSRRSQRKKTADDSRETVDVSEESKPEPKTVKRKTSSKRRVKKKVTLSADDNIIYDDPDTAFELGKRKSSKVSSDPPKKLKGVPSLTPKEQEAADIMQALKESKKTSKRQPRTEGSSKGTGTIPRVPDESTVVSATSSEETDKLDDEEKDDKTKSGETKSDEDDIYKYKIYVHKDQDEEILNVEVEDSDKGDEEVTDAAKADADKTSKVMDNLKKTKLPLTSSSLSVSLGFGDQFLKLSSDSSLVSTVKDTTNAEINSLLDVNIQSEVPHNQSSSMLSVPVSVISKPSLLTPVRKSPSSATITTLPPTSVSTTSFVPQQTKTLIPTPPITADAPTITTVVSEFDTLSVIQLRVAKLEKNVHKLKKIDLSAEALAALKTQVPSVVDNYLRSKKSDLYLTMHANRSFNINPDDHRLYHALMEVLIEDKRVADIIQDYKRKHDDDEDPPARPNQGKASSKGSKTSKFAPAKELVEEPIAEVVMDDAGDDVVHDDDQLQDASEPKTTKTPNPYWFTQPPRPPTPDPKWNKRQVVLDQPEQPWFNQMVFSIKDPLTFDDFMATSIDFSKLNWNNPKGHRYPFNMSKPLPLQGHPGHLTVAADYFFNNDMEYPKYFDLERTYTTSITKTKVARYEIEWTEDMVPTLWSPTKVWVKKLHGYSHLEEIMVKRADRQFYKFKEGDFVDLHLNDIEDMLLLTVQHSYSTSPTLILLTFLWSSYVHKKSRHQETCRGFTAWCRELPEET
nr:hypothetical protein [Tanacetum cinerariifolium]